MRSVDRASGAWARVLAAASGLGASLVPVGLCPACWPALAGGLSTLGLGALVGRGLLPIAALFLLLSLAALAHGAIQQRGYGPLFLGSLGAGALLIGRFYIASDAASHVGIAALLSGAVWNSWPARFAGRPRDHACPRTAG
jgi:mercuric ion transport protein